MGFLKQLFGLEETARLPQIQPTRPAPAMPKTKPVKNDISEPVLSLIQTLKDGEWSFEFNLYSEDLVKFTHEWFGNTFSMWQDKDYITLERTWKAQSDWMTNDEKLAVGAAAYQHMQDKKAQRLAKERESFMVLTTNYKGI